MPSAPPNVDVYIANAPAFARPLLERVRAAFHDGCPDLEERIKWGTPSFEFRGILGGMAAYKRHATFGFWKARLIPGFADLVDGEPRASAMQVRLCTPDDLPPHATLVAFVREARRLNLVGAKDPGPRPGRGANRVPVPADLQAALADAPRAAATFASLAAGHRREYVDWIEEARRPGTRTSRIAKAVEWLAEGKRRNWRYERRK